MSLALNTISDTARQSHAGQRRPGHLLPEAVVCASDGLIMVSVENLGARVAIRSLLLDGNVAVTEPVATRGDTRHFLVGKLAVPSSVGASLATLQLISESGGQVVWSNTRPVAVRHESGVFEQLLAELTEADRLAAITALMKASAAFKQPLDSLLAATIVTVAQQQAASPEPWYLRLAPTLFYARLTLAQSEGPAAITARVTAFVATSNGLTPLACPTAMITGGKHAHMLFTGRIEPGSLIVAVIGGRLVAAPFALPTQSSTQPPIEEIASRLQGDQTALKLYLLARCTEIYGWEKSQQVLDAGNLLWAFTNFPSRAYVRPDIDFGVSVENILPVPGKGVLIIGWMWDPQQLLDALYVRDGLGRTGRISATLYRYDRPDVRDVFKSHQREPAGFMAFQPFEFAEDLWPTYQVFGALKGGIPLDIATDVKATRKFLAKPETLLALMPPDKVTASMLATLAPAIAYLQTKSIKRSGIGRTVHYGEPVKDPVVSIVVPLYKRIDHARHQIVHFANDPEFAKIELIYVLDAPELENELDTMLASMSRIYQRSMTLAVMQENSGFAGATNAGCSIARGQYLLLLNSDVIPDQPGWCSKLWAVLDRNDKIGAVGARLLYEDGSLQHAGMAYEKDVAGNWKCVHPGKGFRAGHPGEPKSGPVAAVTAACMMMRTALYKQLGGLNQDYVIGDFEDSDLCMKIASLPLTLWYCADATLFHLERQSMGTDGRYTTSTWRYNQHLHQQRWGRLIEQIQAKVKG